MPKTPMRQALSLSGKDGVRVGFITSGGYGHTAQKKSGDGAPGSVAHADGREPNFTTHIVGVERGAQRD